MFLNEQPENFKESYIEILKSIGALSKLFSDNNVPYLYYRTAENAFCLAFNADNLARGDTSVDARKNGVGVGLKTFINTKNGDSFQKVAEFNKARNLYSKDINNPENLVRTVSKLRNRRIESSIDIHGLENVIYHSVIRDKGIFYLVEEPMETVSIDKIRKVTSKDDKIVFFEDDKAEYKFNISKSTLFKRFYNKPILEFEVKIFENPFELLEVLYSEKISLLKESADKFEGVVYLPLYSERGDRNVPEKSGLNQWNAGGRARNEKEVYIPIPLWIHREFENFFPPRDEPFNLKLPNGRTIIAKVCQQGGKALMSNPNSDLGEWLLDEVLKVKPGELVTINQLDEIGIDSVEIRKIDSENFEIDFKETGTFADFKDNSLKDE